MALESVLLLSERFGWLGFSDKKGWPVLIGIAVLGSAISVLLLWFVVSVLLRRRFQFGVLSLLLLVLTVATACGWFRVRIGQAERQRAAVRATEQHGGRVDYDWEVPRRRRPPGSKELRAWLGVDFFAEVASVGPQNTHDSMREFTDEDLVRLTSATRGIVDLDVSMSQVTDAGLSGLDGLRNLKSL